MTNLDRIQARRLRVYARWSMTRDPRLWAWLLILDSAYHAIQRRSLAP
jgi:hypothetical protein